MMEVIIILLASACSSADEIRGWVPDGYFVTCMQNERYWRVAQAAIDPIIYDYYNVVFVTVDRQEDFCGLAFRDGNYAWACNFRDAIQHEALHLVEDAHCTSDGYHAKDAECQ